MYSYTEIRYTKQNKFTFEKNSDEGEMSTKAIFIFFK